MPHVKKKRKSGKANYLMLGARPDAERIRVLKDYATRAAQQLGSKLDGTVHCELLDYYACIMLQQHFAALHIAAPLPPPMLRADVVDIAKGYYVATLRHLRPEITIESVAAHASAVFSQLRTIAAQRSPPLRRALVDGEAFDAVVHVWDVDATRVDWVEKFTAAYKEEPPIIIHRYSALVAAQAAREERERLSNDAVRDKRCVLHYIGDLELCSNGCGAQIWPGEAMLCCRGGKHILGEDLNPPIHPDYMDILKMDGFSADSRSYNQKLALATIGTSPTVAQGGVGFHIYKGGMLNLFGTVYAVLHDHHGGPSGLDAYRVSDKFLFDGAAADRNEHFADGLIKARKFLLKHHPFARRLPRVDDMPGERINLDKLLRIDARSAPRARMEIAEVSSGIPGTSSNVVVYFDLGRSDRDEPTTAVTVRPSNALWETLQWPLLYEEGVGGFFFKEKGNPARVRSASGHELTLQDYTKCMLLQNMRFSYAGRVMQEWLLAMHSRQVAQQLDYLRNKQFQKRVVRREDMKAAGGGKGEKVRMPASVVGSKAYQSALMEDTLAVTGTYGKSTLFITLTTNPRWKEIEDALLPGQSWTDRPDIVCRVFKLKLQEFMHDLRKGTFFKDKVGNPWKSKYTIHVIEFQKRGLPHAHILVRLEGDDADIPRRGVDVDRIIQAHMPPVIHGHRAGCDCDEHRLRHLVLKNMCHECAKNVCITEEDPRCKRRFPKATNVEETTSDESGYPLYKRMSAEDAFVVPYNRVALLKYETHVNFELHKYLHKGPDTLRINFAQVRNALSGSMNVNDEVLMFQTFRYLSAGEAFYRVANFDMHHTDVGCTRLTCHLEGKDWVGKDRGDQPSKLLTYFLRPRPELDDLLYTDYYARHNVVEASVPEWEAHEANGEALYSDDGEGRRFNAYYMDNSMPPNKVAVRSGMHVARIHAVPVTQGELYYLRLLLTCVPARSYKDLLTFGDTVHATYRDAAEAHGLITVEGEFFCALGLLAKNHEHNSPSNLRYTFIMMVLHGGEGVPAASLYERFKYFMAMDITASGEVRPPMLDEGPTFKRVYARLPPVEFDEEGDSPSLFHHEVHEYHLLRMLSELLEKNSTRTLEDMGLPSLLEFAQRRAEGAAQPSVQLHLEQILHVAAGMEQPTAAILLHIAYMRKLYARRYPQLLTGAALLPLLAGARPGPQGVIDTFLSSINKNKEEETFTALYAALNPEQKGFADDAIKGLQYQAVRLAALKRGDRVPDLPQGTTRCFHLQARGGRGKSFVTKCVIAKALAMGLVVCVSAFTGVAAILLPRGQTCHKAYGLPLDVSQPTPSSLSTGMAQSKLLAVAALHVIDEVECLHRYLFDAASDVVVRSVNAFWRAREQGPFGGSMVLISGDYHQTLPITAGLNNEDVLLHSLVRSSPKFADFATTKLTIPQRNKEDVAYDEWLEMLSVNRAPGPEHLGADEEPPIARRVFIPEQCFRTDNEDAALTWLFGAPPPKSGPFPPLDPFTAMLCILNNDVDRLNDVVLERYIPGDTFIAEAAHERVADVSGYEDGMARHFATQEYMKSVSHRGVPSATLRLKKGCLLILTRNMLTSLGLVNGTKLILLSEPPAPGDFLRVLHVKTVPLGGDAPQFFDIPRISFDLTTPGGLPFVRRQFPVRLAYVMTSNKAQGQTLNKSCGDTRHENFAHGQCYVTNSRGRSFATLGFLHAPCAPDGAPASFVNVVSQRALGESILHVRQEEVAKFKRARLEQRADIAAVESSSSSEEEEGGGGGGARMRARAPSALRRGAMSLKQRREQIRDEAMK